MILTLAEMALIIYVFKNRLFTTTDNNERINDLIGYKLLVIIFLFGISFSYVYSGFYRTNSPFFIGNQSLTEFLIQWLIYAIITIILIFVLIRVLHLDRIKIVRFQLMIKRKYKYAFFLLILFLMTSFYSQQSLSFVKDNEYTISSNIVPSSDFSKIYFTADHDNSRYLIIKNLQTDNFTKFLLRNNVNPHYLSPYYLEISDIKGEAYIFLDGGDTGAVTVFNYENKSSYQTYLYESTGIMLNNSLYGIDSPYYKDIWIYPVSNDNLAMYHGQILLNASDPFSFYSVSPDFSKLITFSYNHLPNDSYELNVQYYTIDLNSENKTILVSHLTEDLPLYPKFNNFYTQPLNWFIWNSNCSKVSYSFFQGNNTIIYSFNFNNLMTSEIAQIPQKEGIMNIDLVHSLIILSHFQIYSFSDSTVTLKQQLPMVLMNWDNSKVAGVATRNGNAYLRDAYLISYDLSTNQINQNLLLGPSIFQNDKVIFSDLQILISGFLMITLAINLYFITKEFNFFLPNNQVTNMQNLDPPQEQYRRKM